MKTFIVVAFFGILTYTFAFKLKYGESSCQEVEGLEKFDLERFFKGNWYLTHSTPSTRVTESTICRDYSPTKLENGTIYVPYEYNENGVSGNRYNIHCYGTQNEDRDDLFNFDCYSNNERGEKADFHIDVYFLATDYDNYGLVYRCATIGDHTEDNVFVIYRQKNPDHDKVQEILTPYGLTIDKFISRQNATCTNK